jgi:hypothetical protein
MLAVTTPLYTRERVCKSRDTRCNLSCKCSKTHQNVHSHLVAFPSGSCCMSKSPGCPRGSPVLPRKQADTNISPHQSWVQCSQCPPRPFIAKRAHEEALGSGVMPGKMWIQGVISWSQWYISRSTQGKTNRTTPLRVSALSLFA